MLRFAAIDFETATSHRDSACALGVVVVEGERIVDRLYALIQPPSEEFWFTHIHGLTWNDVRSKPDFAHVWRKMERQIGSVAFMAAHNASFDRSVMSSCCAIYHVREPQAPYVCTVRVARQVWDIRPTKLSDVCLRLRIPLRHHHADSDAEACARIILAARAAGWDPEY